MAGDAEKLVIDLEARVNDLEKGMKKAQAIANKAYSGMKRDSGSATKQMETDMVRSTGRINQALAATSTKIGTMGKAMVAGFVGGIAAGGIAGVVSSFGQIANSIADIGDKAKQAGIDVEAFQELAAVARANRLEVDDLSAAMREMALRADEFVVSGAGSGAEAFQRLGITADQLKIKLKDPSALLSEIIGKVQQLDRAAQIRVFDEIFGGDGERLIRLLDMGQQGLEETIAKARQTGQVLDSELIERAADLDRAFSDVAATVGTELQGSIINAGWQLHHFIQQFQDFQSRTSTSLDQSMRDLGEERLRLEKEIVDIQREQSESGGVNGMIFESRLNEARTRMEGILAEEREILAILEQRQPPKPAAMDTPGAGPTWGDFTKTFEPPKSAGGGGGGGGGGRASAISETERQANAVRDLIVGLELERELIGLSALDQEKLNALRRAGVDAMSAEGQQITKLINDIHAQRASVDAITQTYDMLGQAGMSAVQGIIGAMQDGKIQAEEFGAILSNVLSMAANFFLNQAFGGLGSIFGGGGGGLRLGYQAGVGHNANGTDNWRGGPTWVGERGPEIVNLPKGAQVIPNHELRGGGGTTVVQLQLSPDLEARILQQAAGQTVQIAGQVAGKQVKALERNMPNVMMDIQQRRF